MRKKFVLRPCCITELLLLQLHCSWFPVLLWKETMLAMPELSKPLLHSARGCRTLEDHLVKSCHPSNWQPSPWNAVCVTPSHTNINLHHILALFSSAMQQWNFISTLQVLKQKQKNKNNNKQNQTCFFSPLQEKGSDFVSLTDSVSTVSLPALAWPSI